LVRISILYPSHPGSRFDFDYYVGRHMPRSIELLSSHPGFRAVSVERGVGGAEPGSPPGYAAACFYTFDTADSFLAAFMPHAAELQADISNYTDIGPRIQVNDVLLEKRGGA
jgi:uncharacterized protein (TIGR02118 family)